MSELMKLSQSNDSVRATLPKNELRKLGLVDDDGDLDGEHWVKVDRTGDRFTLSLVSP